VHSALTLHLALHSLFWAGHHGPLDENRAMGFSGVSWPSGAQDKPNHPEENREGARGAQAIPQGASPNVLQSDNGGEFTNACMKELVDNLHIKHITSLPYGTTI